MVQGYVFEVADFEKRGPESIGLRPQALRHKFAIMQKNCKF